MPESWIGDVDVAAFRRAVMNWYRRNGRDLPWRNTRDPYSVWVSEIMLQQTLVGTAIPYYSRFLRAFPTVELLARADESEVLRHWQGLGYYRRARNLHAAAKIVMTQFGGQLPDDPEELASLPGLGKYTANAILSFALNKRLPILEVNTVRLWSRLTAAAGDPRRAPLHEQLWKLAEDILPQRRPSDFNQAVMEIGSQICKAGGPICQVCPLTRFCRGLQTGDPGQYPEAKTKTPIVEQDNVAIIVRVGDRVLVQKRPPDGRWGNLWEFPTAERHVDEEWENAAKRVLDHSGGNVEKFRLGCERLRFKHGIMHYRITLKCFDMVGDSEFSPRRPNAKWAEIDSLDGLPFSSPQSKIVQSIQERPDVQGSLFG